MERVEGWIGLKPSSQQYIYHPPPPRLWAAPSAQGPPFPGGSPLVHGRCGLNSRLCAPPWPSHNEIQSCSNCVGEQYDQDPHGLVVSFG